MPTLYLDRDGVINYDFGHVGDPTRFLFIPQIFPLIRCFTKLGYKTVVATNQSGISRGFYTTVDFYHLSISMCNSLHVYASADVEVRYCPHHPDTHCFCRKPSPGLLLDPYRTTHDIFIGDKPSDMLASLNANISNRWLISKTPSGPYTLSFHNHSQLLAHVTNVRAISDVTSQR